MKKHHTGVFLNFFLDSLKLERSWAFTFLGSLSPRDRTIGNTFMSFSGSLSKTKKQHFWSTVPCLSSFIKMKDQKKRRGFMRMFIYCSSPSSHFQAWHPFRVHVKWVGYPLPPSQDYSIESILCLLVTLPVIHGIWCLFRRVNAARSYYLTCQ